MSVIMALLRTLVAEPSRVPMECGVRKLVVLVLLCLLSFGGLPARASINSDETDFINRINALRKTKGVAQLRVNVNLTDKAREWAGRMATQDRIWHSRPSDGVTANWQKLGENVGVGGSIASLHQAFVQSPRHYDNLVDPVFRHIGLGVATANGKTFVSEVFMQRRPNKRAPPRRAWRAR